MKTVKSKILPIVIAVAVLICMFAVPVSAAPSSGYYDSGKVHLDDWQTSGFLFYDLHEDVQMVENKSQSFYSFSLNVVNGEFNIYNMLIPTDAISVSPGDEYYLNFCFDFYSSAFMNERDGEIGIHMSTMSGHRADVSYGISVSPESTSPDGWPSITRNKVMYTVRITSSADVVLQDIHFNFEMLGTRGDIAYYMQIYKDSYYRIYGGDPTSPDYPRYQNPADGELGGAAGDLNDKENELDESLGSFNDSAADSGHSADQPFKAFSLSTFRDGMLCWQQLLTPILGKSLWLYNFINISLALGLFAFLVGMATVVVQVHTSKVRRENGAAARRSRSKRGG